MIKEILNSISWIGHASFRIKHNITIYIDPWKIPIDDKADIILVTHSHYDHFSPEDINKLQKGNTHTIAPADCIIKGQGVVSHLKPGEQISIKNTIIETYPAYNINKNFHPKHNQWVGYIVEIAGVRIYHAGDTDFIPEMTNIHADIALLPIGGTYTMDINDAIDAAKTIKPKIVIPMHYGDIVGSKNAGNAFSKKYTGETLVLSPI